MSKSASKIKDYRFNELSKSASKIRDYRSNEFSKSASKVRDFRYSAQKEAGTCKSRRSVSSDSRNRGSYVPEAKRSSSEERKSGKLFKLLGARKSSINLFESKRKDSRPLNDKNYLKRKISQLEEFLNEAGFNYDAKLNPNQPPSKKDFEKIFQFLYRFFDPTYEVKKIEEEAPKILKNLCYPFTINRSSLVCLNRTNWPSLMGVLLWLMDLCMFSTNVDMNSLIEITDQDDGKAQIDKILFRFIYQCYYSKMDDKENEEAVFKEIINNYILKDRDVLIEKNKEKKLLIESVEKQIEDYKSSVEHKALLEKNIEKYQNYILKMKSHFNSKSEVCEKLMEEMKVKELELKALQGEISQKQEEYDAQGFDGKKHLGFFEAQKKELNEKLKERRSTVKSLQDKCWEAEIENRKKTEKITAADEDYRKLHDNVVESYKDVVSLLSNIKTPQVQKLLQNFDFNFPAPEYFSGIRRDLSNTTLVEEWKSISEKTEQADEILKRIGDSLNQRLFETELKKSELSTKLKLKSLEKDKEEQDLKLVQKTAGDEISVLESSCEKLQEVIVSQQNELSELSKTIREMNEEKKTLHEFRIMKEKELEVYLKDQKELFEYYERNEEQIRAQCERQGNEIEQFLEKLFEDADREIQEIKNS